MESYPSIGVREDLPELRESLNRVLNEMADDGTIQKYENKWVKSNFNHKSFAHVIRSNIHFYIGFFIIFILMEFMMIVMVLRLRHYNRAMKYNERIRAQYNLLISMAKTYVSMHLIYLKENRVSEFSSKDFIRENVTDDMNAAEQMKRIMKNTIVPEMQESVLEFTDLSTLAERMGENRTISKEFLGVHIGWIRAQFVAVNYDDKGELAEVVFTTLSIDHEKRREEYLLRISNYDELTGLYNRHAYENDVTEIKKKISDKLIVISFDLNGLKKVNDTKGHKAGDAMLQCSAKNIEAVFSKYGKVYRVGGDEFMALIYMDYKEMLLIKEKFYKCLKSDSKEIGFELSIACGYAAYIEHKDAKFDELEMLADKNMYQEKALYYKTSIYNGKE